MNTKFSFQSLILIVTVTLLSLVNPVTSQAQDIERAHALYLLNFARNIQWPSGYNKNEFVIGVLKNASFAERLRIDIANRPIRFQKVVIKEFETVEEIEACNILYVGQAANNLLTNVIERTAHQPILVVTHAEGLGQQGSGINLVKSNRTLKFELNRQAIEARKMKISLGLSLMGTEVN